MPRLSSIQVDFLELDDFVESQLGQVARNRFYFGPIELYARLAARSLGDRTQRTLDLADVTIKPDHQGKGFFSALLAHMEGLAERKGLAMYVESITSPIVRQALIRRGYSFSSGFSSNAWMTNDALIARRVVH